MASISEVTYEETRSKDGTTFSKKLNVKVSLDAGEGAFDISKPLPPLLGLTVSHVLDFVHQKIVEGPSEAFVTGDKVIPAVTPPKAIEMAAQTWGQPETGFDKRNINHPCVGCPTEKACPAPCSKWETYVTAGGTGMPPKLATHGDPDAPRVAMVVCSVCGTGCEKVESKANPGTFYNRCMRCKDNRTKEGKPFPPKKLV